jgi:thiamine transport system permease protein
VGNSLGYALAATVIALGVGLPAAVLISARRGRLSQWFDTLLMLPLGTSAVTVGFGFLIALDSPIDLRASVALIPIAHALVATPFVVRASVPVLRAVRERLREAAAMLGASPARTFREVDLPIVTRVAAVGAAFALAVSLGEFGATIFLARPGGPTIPIAIYRFLGRPGILNFGQAMALSVLLMVMTAGAIMAVERSRLPGPGAF